MAWSEVHAHAGGTNSAAVTLNTTGANLLVLCITTYDTTISIANISETGASANTWTKLPTYAPSADVRSKVALFYVVSPNTNSSHGITYTLTTSYTGLVAWAFSQGAATTYVSEVGYTGLGSGTTVQAGSIGSNGDLVVTGVGFYANSGYSIDSGFSAVVEEPYASGAAMGTASAWLTVSGAVNPTWTASGSNTHAAASASFTSSGGGGGGGGNPWYAYANM